VAALEILDALSRREVASARLTADRTAAWVETSPNLEYARGVCALGGGHLEEAALHLEAALAFAGRVLSVAPFEGVTNWLSLSALSEVRYLQGRMKESLRLHARASAVRGREGANAFHGAPRTLIDEGDPGWAMHLLSLAGRLAPQDARPWLRGGEILLELGLLRRAVEWLEQAGKRAPGEEGIERLLEAARSAP
jgi:tetratricopeptide (TPR) repeat protein